MQTTIIDRLFSSFTDLEGAIKSARGSLEKKGSISPEILKRLDSYDDILAKQKELAEELCKFVSKGDWNEVTRYVGLINGLSSMIRDDARAILSSLALNTDTKLDEEANYC